MSTANRNVASSILDLTNPGQSHDENELQATSFAFASTRLLILVLDTNIASWYRHFETDNGAKDMHVVMDQLLAFCRAFQNLSEYTQLIMISMGSSKQDA